jgi:hypothetical protein
MKLLLTAPFILSWLALVLASTALKNHPMQQVIIGISLGTIGAWSIIFRDHIGRSTIEQNYKLWGRFIPTFWHGEHAITFQTRLTCIGGAFLILFGVLLILQIVTLKR